jgi:biopolymer transport protein ExbB
MRFTDLVRQSFRALVIAAGIAMATLIVGAPIDAVLAQTTSPDSPATSSEARAPAPAVEAVENPYGIDSLWKQGDFVAKGTLIILTIMSMGTWYVGIAKVIEQAKLFKHSSEVDRSFWTAASVPEGAGKLDESSAFRFIARCAVDTSMQFGSGFDSRIDQASWTALGIQRAVDVVNSRMQSGLALLATVGSTAPFVGLFGTVWGIYHALTAIGIAGQASIDKVAGPVGEALIMTALGLAVAVPAVLGYNWLVRRNKAAMDRVRHFSNGLHMTLIGTGVPAQQVGSGPSGAKAA